MAFAMSRPILLKKHLRCFSSQLRVRTMNELRFANLVKKVEVDEAAFANEVRKTTPADRYYIIFFTPRSGSSWLTSVLSATRHLGYPEEYINPEFLPNI